MFKKKYGEKQYIMTKKVELRLLIIKMTLRSNTLSNRPI